MRIAAGVLLIIVSFINGCAGLGYAAAGGCAATVGAVGSKAITENHGSFKFDGGSFEMKAEDSKAAVTQLETVEAAGGGMAGFGLFLLVMLGLQMAAAVCCFTSRAPTFVLVVGILGVLAEVGGFAIFYALSQAPKQVPLFSHLPGLVASGLAIVAALLMKRQPVTPPAPTA